MKKIAYGLFAMAALGLLSTGCTVSRYERTVTIQRNPAGEILGITEVEHMTQSGKRKKLPTRFLYDNEIVKGGAADKAAE